MDDLRLIAAGRLPAADCLDHEGWPCWRLDSLLAWLKIERAEFIAMLPSRCEARQHRGPDLYEVHR